MHPGKYSSPALLSLIPQKTVDNKIIHLSNWIKPGNKDFFSKELEERGWKPVKDLEQYSLEKRVQKRLFNQENE